MKPALRVVAGAAPATVQDGGRRGYERFGVPRGGAMDAFALAAANMLVGNHADAAAIEITAGGAVFEALCPVAVALAGGELRPQIDGADVPLWTSLLLEQGAQLSFGSRGGACGARCYVAMHGGIEVPTLLGSRSTYLPGAWGGHEGRALRAGDVLHAGTARSEPYSLAGRQWSSAARPAYVAEPQLRLLPGPHDALLGGIEWLFGAPFTVGPASNRIGYRLAGPKHAHTLALPSFGVLPGALQLPPDGAPILLLADAQPTGGYPVVGVVAAADLPLAAQLLPGDTLRFAPISPAEARAAWHEQQRVLAAGPEDDAVGQLLGWAGA